MRRLPLRVEYSNNHTRMIITCKRKAITKKRKLARVLLAEFGEVVALPGVVIVPIKLSFSQIT